MSGLDDVLEHYGIKGMHWGKRRAINLVDDKTGAKTPIKYNPKKTKVTKNEDGSLDLTTKSKREQDNLHKQAFKDRESEDSQKARQSESIAKVAGAKALSNKELQDLVTRMNLEQQYKRLAPPTSSQKAGKFVGDLLLNVGKQQAAKLVNDAAAKQVARVLAGK